MNRVPTSCSHAPVLQSIQILGIRIDSVTMAQTVGFVREWLGSASLHQICTANPEFVMKAQDDAEFARVLAEAELAIPDGIGLVLASHRLGNPLPERVPGSALVYHVAELCAETGARLFLLGAADGVAEQAAEVLKQQYSGLTIAGVYAGTPDVSENDAIVRRINESAADVLYVAYGAPKQDKWIGRNRDNLETVRVAIGVGGSLDIITGQIVRPPMWVQRLGLEWLHRLGQQPHRFRRLFILPRFVLRILLNR